MTPVQAQDEEDPATGVWLPNSLVEGLSQAMEGNPDWSATVRDFAEETQASLAAFASSPSLDALAQNFTFIPIDIPSDEGCMTPTGAEDVVCRTVCLTKPLDYILLPYVDVQAKTIATGGIMRYNEEQADEGTVLLTPGLTGGAYGLAEWSFKYDSSIGTIDCA